MPTYLLTWNPAKFSWDQPDPEAIALAKGESIESRWSCGNSKSIRAGSRVFMLKQGKQGRGIVAGGWVIKGTYQDLHWEADQAAAGVETNFVRIRLEAPLDDSPAAILDVEGISTGALGRVYWVRPASGTELEAEAAEELEVLWAEHTASSSAPLEVSQEVLELVEGHERLRLVRHRSREIRLRNAKILAALDQSNGRLTCEVPGCGFDFSERYGKIGEGYAQVHHLKPLASFDGPVPVTLDDLAVVCANCHAMIHRGGACRSLNELIR